MANQFGERLKQLREQNNLLQRQVASLLEIDTPMLSKIERGERKAKKEQVMQLAQIMKVSNDELLTLWLADQLQDVIEGEALADEALKKVSNNIKKSNKKDNSKDGK
jgi:transcriptional regulator with XRE-family HTH domain